MKKTHESHAFLWASMFFGTLGFFLTASVVLPDPEFSVNERRRLNAMPQLTADSLLSGTFGERFDAYAQDSIAGRNSLLYLKSWTSLHLFGAKDDLGLVRKDGSLIQLEKQIDQNSLDHAAAVFDRIEENCLAGTNCKVYVSIIPDKSYFLEDDQYLLIDYNLFFEKALQALPQGQSIDLTDTLSLADYFNTDPHWRQEAVIDSAKKLANTMGVEISDTWTVTQVLEDFTGSLQGRTSLKAENDDLACLWNPSMDTWTLTVYDEGRPVKKPVYDLDRLQSNDPYTYFLQGNPGLAVLENPNVHNGRELIVFRDSFGSAIIPLLADGYEKVTMVDLRNLPSWRLKQLIDFHDQDVLFLYSTSVLNASSSLK